MVHVYLKQKYHKIRRQAELEMFEFMDRVLGAILFSTSDREFTLPTCSLFVFMRM